MNLAYMGDPTINLAVILGLSVLLIVFLLVKAWLSGRKQRQALSRNKIRNMEAFSFGPSSPGPKPAPAFRIHPNLKGNKLPL